MHELSIAQSLVELVEDELAAREDAYRRGDDTPGCPRVRRVSVRVGALSGVVPEALSSAFAVAARRSPARGAALAIEWCPAVVWCEPCGGERAVVSPQHMRCPDCGTPSGTLVGGRELELTTIEVTDDATPHDDGTPSDDAAPHPAGADADPEEE